MMRMRRGLRVVRDCWQCLIAPLSAVAAVAVRAEKLGLRAIGFRGASKWSLLWAALIVLFFVLVFGPVAYAALEALNAVSFDAGRASFEGMPHWYLALAIVIVAGVEEWLYRRYATERPVALTGKRWIAAYISLGAFSLVHVPLWGTAVATMTLCPAPF